MLRSRSVRRRPHLREYRVSVLDSFEETFLNDSLALEVFELARAEAEQLAIDVGVMLSEERRGFYFDGRVFEAHRTAGHREVAAHGMLDRDDHAALFQMRIVQQLDAIEHGAAWNAGLAEDAHHFELRVTPGPFIDNRGQRLDVLRAISSREEALVGRELGPAHRLAHALEHVGRGAQDVAMIVVATGRAFVDVAGTAAAEAVAGARRGVLRDVRSHHGNADEIQYRFLHRDFHFLPLARALPLDVR